MCSTARPVPQTRRRSCCCTAFRRRRGCGPLIDRLADRYRMVAPGYPGFGHSDAPPADSFSYTFDHVADYVERFTDEIGLTRYSLVVQDYGGPIGMRLAVRRPEQLSALVV